MTAGLGLVQDGLERERNKLVAFAFVELALKLDPMQTKRVQERRQALHDAQDAHGDHGPRGKYTKHDQGTNDRRSDAQANLEQHGPQYLGELSVSQTQRPQTQIRSSV